MTVTKLEELGKNRIRVFIDGEFAFVVYKSELSQYHLEEEKEVPEESYRLLTEEVLVKRARLRAMDLLTARPYSEAGLRKKLKEAQYSPQLVDNALAYVKSFGYVDDARFGRDLAESLMGKYSIPVIRRKMAERGLDKDLIEEILGEVSEACPEAEEELLLSLIRKKCKGSYPADQIEEAKLWRFLGGKGFSPSQIRSGLRAYEKEL